MNSKNGLSDLILGSVRSLRSGPGTLGYDILPPDLRRMLMLRLEADLPYRTHRTHEMRHSAELRVGEAPSDTPCEMPSMLPWWLTYIITA